MTRQVPNEPWLTFHLFLPWLDYCTHQVLRRTQRQWHPQHLPSQWGMTRPFSCVIRSDCLMVGHHVEPGERTSKNIGVWKVDYTIYCYRTFKILHLTIKILLRSAISWSIFLLSFFFSLYFGVTSFSYSILVPFLTRWHIFFLSMCVSVFDCLFHEIMRRETQRRVLPCGCFLCT